jgi:simple sugar transport system substrate-binding protein
MRDVDPKVDEAIQTLNMADGPTRRRLLKGTGLVSATAAASALLAACGSNGSSASSKTSVGSTTKSVGNFPSTPAWQFWFVNHVTTNPFFVPTISGTKDAAALLGLPTPKWGGSADSNPTQMVSYLNTAIAAKAAGIATTVINSKPSDTTFTTPVAAAMNAGIPVVSYNADGPLINGVPTPGTNRLCYVGQALYLSGQQLGERIKSLAKSKGEVVLFIATPGTANIQPRSDGARAVLEAAGFTVNQQATGALTSQETTAEKAFLLGHKSIVAACAVDAGSTELLGPALASAGLGKIPAGGFDLTPGTLTAIQGGQLDFTINQDPYLQGFLPVLYLYLYNLTGGLVLPPDTDTGLSFVTKSTVGPYISSATTYEGSTGATKPTLVPRSGAIQNPVATTST